MTDQRETLSKKQVLLFVQTVRASVLSLILVVSLGSFLLQPNFINWSLLGPFYLVLILAYILQMFWQSLVDTVEKADSRTVTNLFFVGFLVDALLLSALIHFSGISQSLFLFLHLVNILLAGVLFATRGALLVALVTSVSFSLTTLFGPDLKPLQSLFMLALNNIAFFTVAGLSGYLADLLNIAKTELVKTDLNLQSAEEFNRVLIENLPVGMISFTDDGSIINFNPTAQKIFKVFDSGALTNFFDLFGDLKPLDIEGFRGDKKYMPSATDESRILHVNIRSFHSQNIQKQLYIALVEDLTDVRMLEYNARQNEKLAAIGGLAAGIAHEIRNPLAGISGSIELLSQTTQNDDDKKLMKIILREIDRLNNLITEFLEYSRPEKPPTDPVDLSQLMNEVMDSLLTNKQVRQDVVVEKQLEPSAAILGHKDKLKQAFLNIVINAYQAMQDSEKPSLFVNIEKQGQSVVVKIKDSGSGMSEQTRKRMFEPFHTTKSKGTGLGLAVTHKILEGHRAQIFVESEKGVGTEFVLHFPSAQIEMK